MTLIKCNVAIYYKSSNCNTSSPVIFVTLTSSWDEGGGTLLWQPGGDSRPDAVSVEGPAAVIKQYFTYYFTFKFCSISVKYSMP